MSEARIDIDIITCPDGTFDSPSEPVPTTLKVTKASCPIITSISDVVTRNDEASTATIARFRGDGMQRKKEGREFSRMGAETVQVVKAARAFFDWQDWQDRKTANALGYPTAATFADGYKGARAYGSVSPELGAGEVPPEHKDICDAIKSLPDIRRKVFVAVHRHNHDRTKIARAINGTKRGVDTRLGEAYMIVAGFLRGRGWAL